MKGGVGGHLARAETKEVVKPHQYLALLVAGDGGGGVEIGGEILRGGVTGIGRFLPELRVVRAAVAVGTPMPEPCPICDEETLVSVSYVFGGRLPAFGRCITKTKELDQFAKQRGDYACYVVEVCATCRWNHLIRMFRLGKRPAAAG